MSDFECLVRPEVVKEIGVIGDEFLDEGEGMLPKDMDPLLAQTWLIHNNPYISAVIRSGDPQLYFYFSKAFSNFFLDENEREFEGVSEVDQLDSVAMLQLITDRVSMFRDEMRELGFSVHSQLVWIGGARFSGIELVDFMLGKSMKNPQHFFGERKKLITLLDPRERTSE
jgi:hypothetical protein